MDLRRDQTRIAHAPAKLNLYLEITGRRDDGFHDLETIMVPIRLRDTLRMTPTPSASDGEPGEIRLEVHSSFPLRTPRVSHRIPAGADNLVVKALELLRERSGCCSGAHVELVKRIPTAAGLGGGSSDAATALRLANRAWRLDWPADRLAELAAELGSDVPFFLSNGAAICRGRGENVERIPSLPPLHFVIVKPPVGLSTAEVYRAHDALAKNRSESGDGNWIAAGLASQRAEFAAWMHNRLQAAAASLSPSVELLRSVFERLGFLAHQLSGSGSAYFGVCRHAQHARRLANILRTQQLGLVYATRSCA